MCVPWTLRVFLFLISHFLILCLLFLHDFDTNNNAAQVVANLRKFAFTIVLSYYFVNSQARFTATRLIRTVFFASGESPYFSNWINCCWMTLYCFFVTLIFSRHFFQINLSLNRTSIFFCAIFSDQPFSKPKFNFSLVQITGSPDVVCATEWIYFRPGKTRIRSVKGILALFCYILTFGLF